MPSLSTRLVALLFVIGLLLGTIAQAQVSTAAPSATAASWTIKTNGVIRWQQVTPAGALLLSTDAALIAVDTERGQLAWQRPDLGGLPFDSVRPVERSLLMEAASGGMLVIFDPITGAMVFDSRQLG